MRRIRTMNSKKVLKRRMANKRRTSKTWDIIHEDGRQVIQQWRDKRIRLRGARKSYREMLVYSFNLDTLKSFLQNINFMVILQMLIAILSVYLFDKFDTYCDIPINLFVAPIVFPLAFSINTDFQRRERVLEDLAAFKSSGMVWYFCMREWKDAAGLDDEWMTAAHAKLKSLIFHLHEYLLTHKPDRRKLILSVLYEDFSDASQLIEKIRASKLPANPAIVSKAVSLLHGMCASFERLRVVREYRSPRSIRSFNKVFISILPIFLAPYFVYLEKYKDKNIPGDTNQTWPAYYIAVVVAFVFSCLQGVQDKLDDPFDGMSEDDVNLDMIDEWVNGSLVHIMGRMLQLGGYTNSFDEEDTEVADLCCCQNQTECHHKTADIIDKAHALKREAKIRSSNNSNHLSTKSHESHTNGSIKEEPFVQQIFSSLLSRMKSSPPKLDGHLGGKCDDKNSLNGLSTHDVSKAIINTTNSINIDSGANGRRNAKADISLVYSNDNVLYPDHLKNNYQKQSPKETNKHVEKVRDIDYDTTLSDVSISLSVETNNIIETSVMETNVDKNGSFCIDIDDYVHQNDDNDDCDQSDDKKDKDKYNHLHNDYNQRTEYDNHSDNQHGNPKNNNDFEQKGRINENYEDSPDFNDNRKNNDYNHSFRSIDRNKYNAYQRNDNNNNDHKEKISEYYQNSPDYNKGRKMKRNGDQRNNSIDHNQNTPGYNSFHKANGLKHGRTSFNNKKEYKTSNCVGREYDQHFNDNDSEPNVHKVSLQNDYFHQNNDYTSQNNDFNHNVNAYDHGKNDYQQRNNDRNIAYGDNENRNNTFDNRNENRNNTYDTRKDNRVNIFDNRNEHRIDTFDNRNENRNNTFDNQNDNRNNTYDNQNENRNKTYDIRNENQNIPYDQITITNNDIEIHTNGNAEEVEMELGNGEWGNEIRTSNHSSPLPQYRSRTNSPYIDRNPFISTPSIQITPSEKTLNPNEVKVYVQEIN